MTDMAISEISNKCLANAADKADKYGNKDGVLSKHEASIFTRIAINDNCDSKAMAKVAKQVLKKVDTPMKEDEIEVINEANKKDAEAARKKEVEETTEFQNKLIKTAKSLGVVAGAAAGGAFLGLCVGTLINTPLVAIGALGAGAVGLGLVLTDVIKF